MQAFINYGVEMNTWIAFSLVVGIGSTLILDLWVTMVKKVAGIPPTDWGMVGRWLRGILRGNFVLNKRITSVPSTIEKMTGWFFHYLVGIAYALLLLGFWGTSFALQPSLIPVLIIGVVVSTFAGLALLMPAMGGGFFGRKLPNQMLMIIYIIVAHIAFAIGQYGFALLYTII